MEHYILYLCGIISYSILAVLLSRNLSVKELSLQGFVFKGRYLSLKSMDHYNMSQTIGTLLQSSRVTSSPYIKLKIRGTQRQYSENICSEDDLRSRIFGTFVVKFITCLPVLGFPNI